MKHILCILLMLCPALVIAQAGDYTQTLQEERTAKDKEFRKSKDSPIPKPDRRKFQGLHYYPVDSTYRVTATLVRDSIQPTFQMKTNTMRLPVYARYGELHFTLQGQPLKLAVYRKADLVKQVQDTTRLFVPFTDAHTGETTYESGRYLDLNVPTEGNTLTLDFNEAYNPYCAYGGSYSCPITPEENRLPIPISAGEKKYKEH